MCGIAGRFSPTALPDAPEWHQRADSLLVHRGPDGGGYYRDERTELVHRRLALIDLSPTGHQPMGNEDGSIQVIYNGEIYNHPELRRDLQARGHVFRGTSDTEVLVHLYEEAGERLVERLRGIFAFALYDRPRRRLLLARDRYGVKPLFYASLDGQWIFASEIKAILALPGFAPRIDRQACYDFIGLSYVPEPATGFAEIQALPPASIMVIDRGGSRLRRYESVMARPAGRALEDVVEDVGERLVEAVRRQAVADVPVAALLSGGIDSSLVVAAHRKAHRDPTRTFNVRFPDRRHDETETALAVAAHYATRHRTVDLAKWAMTPESIFALLTHFDQPFADTSLIPMYWVARAIREQGIICALSGDGGDETFGGYAHFWRMNTLARMMRLPSWSLAATRSVGTRLAPWTRNVGRQLAKAAGLAQRGRADSAVVLAGLASYLSEEQKAAWVAPDARHGLASADRLYDSYRPTGVTDLEELSRRLTESLFAVSLPSDMLRKVDMMSMRVSLEVRVPMLDEDVVALGLTLPHHLKTNGRSGKVVLRSLARRWLPRSVAEHPKQGFSIPLDVMLPQRFHEAAADLLLGDGARTREVFRRDRLAEWLTRFRNPRTAGAAGVVSREGLYQRVFIALALELWLREHRLVW